MASAPKRSLAINVLFAEQSLANVVVSPWQPLEQLVKGYCSKAWNESSLSQERLSNETLRTESLRSTNVVSELKEF